MMWGLVIPPGTAHSFLTHLTVCSLEASFNCPNSRAVVSLESFPFSRLPLYFCEHYHCSPLQCLWRQTSLSFLVFFFYSISILLPSLFLMKTVSWPELLSQKALFSEALWERWDQYMPGHVLSPSLCKSVLEPFCFNLLLFRAQGSAHSLLLNEMVSQLESAFLKILLCLMILFVNFK